MPQGRWTAVVVASALVATAVGLLYAVLHGSSSRVVPVLALVLLAVVPLVAAWLSGRGSTLATGAGGLAVGIAATVIAAALDQGGTGSLPLTFGVAVAGAIALHGEAKVVWGRLVAVALVAAYAVVSGRVLSAVFAYPLLGFADELTDVIAGRRRGHKVVTST